MSWNFHEDDLRREIVHLRDRLSAQELSIGQLQDQLVKNNDELSSTKNVLRETSDKLRKETEQTLQLESSLKKKTEDLRNEKLTRENVENELRAAREESRNQANSKRETEHLFNRLAQDVNGTQQQQAKLVTEKEKLEAQVRELQGELQRQQFTLPPPPPKTPRRPRASSLTNLKLASLEQDLEQMRSSASTTEMCLESTKEKLSRAQAELVRAENEKAALQKRLAEKDRKLQDVLEDNSDLERELEFYRGQDGPEESEKQALARLEEEQSKVALLEEQLAKLSNTKELEHNLAKLREQLISEASKCEAAELREVDLVAAREEALNELDEARIFVEELTQTAQEKEHRIQDLEHQNQNLKRELDEAGNQTISSTGVGEEKIQEMLDAIARLRAERDKLQGDLEFLHLESKFTIQTLEAQIMHNSPARVMSLNSPESEREQLQRSQLAMSAMAVTVQHLQAKSEHIHNTSVQSTFELTTVDEELTQFRRQLTDAHYNLQEERERRNELELEVEQLEAERNAIKQELTDVLDRYDRLQTAQALPTEDATVVLREEIKMLEGRVVRRTEQIGIHQHDIKRLETNIKLLEERLDEATADLDMAETEKAAMLEDCTTAREERDAAKRALEHMEIEVERVTTLLKEAEQKQADLHARMSDDEGRNERIQSLEEDLRISEAALQADREDFSRARSELEQAHASSILAIEKLKEQAEFDKAALSEELSEHAHELDQSKGALDVSRAEYSETKDPLHSAEKRAASTASEDRRQSSRRQSQQDWPSSHAPTEDAALTVEVERLTSQLISAKEEYQLLADSVREKDALLEENASELLRLSTDLGAAVEKQKDAIQQAQRKQEELDMNSVELNRLISELEQRDTIDENATGVLKEKDDRLAQMGEQIEALEAERTELLKQITFLDAQTGTDLEELRSTLEQERERHRQELKRLTEDIACLRAETEGQLQTSAERNKEAEARHNETFVLLDSARRELQEERTRCDELVREQQNLASTQEEANSLREQIAHLTTEVDRLEESLRQEVDDRKRDQELHGELKESLYEHEAAEADLRQSVERHKEQLSEVRASLMALEDENTTLQSELNNLKNERQNADLKNRHLENRLSANEKDMAHVRQELASAREAFAQAQKSGKTAEINLLLIGQQHERTVSSLRNQLKEHEKDAERIHKLQQIVGEMKEQISEMEALLRAKTTEIEDNDDKFIQLLKEKKKLTNKVESLTKKNNNLQAKLVTASTGCAKSPVDEVRSENVAGMSKSLAERSIAKPRPSVPRASTSREAVPPPVMPIGVKTLETSNARSRLSPEVAMAMEIPTTTCIGKKRPLPDDIDAARAPVEARLADTNRPESTTPPPSSLSTMPTIPSESTVPAMPDFASTPRHRRPLQPPRTGFTPVRGQGLRPTLSQPSPIRKSVASTFKAPTAMQDVTNSPPKAKRQFTEEPGSTAPRTQKPESKGWLKKIRGDGPVTQRQRSRHEPSASDLP